MADKDTEIDQLFSHARQQRDALPDGLAARILADADAVQRVPVANPVAKFWSRLFSSTGGWQGMGGLVAAGLAGVWIGFSAPEFLPDPATYLAAQDGAYMIADLGYDAAYLEDTE